MKTSSVKARRSKCFMMSLPCAIFFSRRRRHTRCGRDWSSDVCSSDLAEVLEPLYRTGSEWEKLHQIYEVQLSRIEEMAERQTLLRRLAEIAEQKLVDQVAAF